MIHALEEEIIAALKPLVADINGTVYNVSEDDGSQIREAVQNEDETVTMKMLPSVIVKFTSTAMEGAAAREANSRFSLVGPYALDHSFQITIWQPRGEGYANFDDVINAVLDLPRVMFESDNGRGYAWTAIGEDEFDETVDMDSRNVALTFIIRETGRNVYSGNTGR